MNRTTWLEAKAKFDAAVTRGDHHTVIMYLLAKYEAAEKVYFAERDAKIAAVGYK